MIAMQILSLLGLTILSCIRLLASSGISWLAWFTVLTVLFIQGSDTFLAVQDLAWKTGLVSSMFGSAVHIGLERPAQRMPKAQLGAA